MLDDLPVATLVAGYARVKRRIDSGIDPASIVAPEGAEVRRDLCAGWRADGAMIHSIETGHGIPYPPLPPAPPPRAPDADANAWIDEPARAPYVMRRRRRLDVVDGEVLIVSAWFRDSHVEPDGNEGAVHEYSLHATVDPATFALVTLAATPHVLPYGECPAAAGHVGRMLGADVGELRTLVGDRLSGPSSCTHLNDCVRALADVPALAAQLPRIGE